MSTSLSNKSISGSLNATGDISTTGKIYVNTQGGDEGGEIFFKNAATNTTIVNGVNIDVYQNKLRFWEDGGTNRGFYLDITAGGTSVGSNLDPTKTLNAEKIRLSATADASTSSTDHAFQIGESNTSNLRMDANEISAYNNGAAANLNLSVDGGTTVFGGLLDSNDTYENNITTTRRAMWISSAGVFGYASSSRETKQDISEADLNVESILSIEPKTFRYIDAVEIMGDEAPIELGMIAEDLHDAGLTHLVDYGKDGSIQGIHYSMYVTALQAVVRHQASQISDLISRVEALENK
jgi:hypothetical protein